MKITWATFAVGWWAICGLPPFSGFYSKDAILAGAYGAGYSLMWAVGLVTAALTAFYMSRMFLTTFHGPERIELGDEHHGEEGHEHSHEHEHAHDHGHAHAHPAHTHVHDDGSVHVHESPRSMTVPLILLALGAIAAGFMLNGGLMPHHETPFGHWLAPSVGEGTTQTVEGGLSEGLLIGLSILAAVIGIGVALAMHAAGTFVRGRRTALGELIAARFGYDGLLHAIFVRGGGALAQALWAFVDVVLIDGVVNGIGFIIAQISAAMRTLQTGYVRNYALVLLLGAVVVIGWYLTRLG
jgi:NADH-quinone oxidoreductase subunit L